MCLWEMVRPQQPQEGAIGTGRGWSGVSSENQELCPGPGRQVCRAIGLGSSLPPMHLFSQPPGPWVVPKLHFTYARTRVLGRRIY